VGRPITGPLNVSSRAALNSAVSSDHRSADYL